MASARKYDVVSFSAASVDINILAEDSHLENYGLPKGLSSPIGTGRLAEILENARDITKTPGSPGANVAMGIALRGGSAAMVGKIANDDHGNLISSRLRSHGVDYTPVFPADDQVITTCVVSLTTPDKERTFAFAGAAAYQLAPEDIDHTLIGEAKIAYFDSYLWLSETGQDTVHQAAQAARESGCKVALALNDAALVARNRDKFQTLASSCADILLGDRNEFMAFFGTKTLEETLQAAVDLGCTASITAGAAGAYVVENGKCVHIPVRKVVKIVDTCGAGDQFAAGFLYGLAQGKTAEESGHIGAQWAADVIQHSGAEPRVGKNAAPPAPKP